MSAIGQVYREAGKAMEVENRRRKSASGLAREAEARRMVMIRGHQARLKAEAAQRRIERACREAQR